MEKDREGEEGGKEEGEGKGKEEGEGEEEVEEKRRTHSWLRYKICAVGSLMSN